MAKESSDRSAATGKKIEKLLSRHKILLLQDKRFPNIVGEIAGEKISGSWWGHPMGREIYNGLVWFEHHHAVLKVRLIDGKVTYLHENLSQDFHSIVCEPRDWQMENLKPPAREIFRYISKAGAATSDDKKFASKEAKSILATLEKRLLVQSDEVHTPSGRHVKEYRSWRNSIFSKSKTGNYLQSIHRIEKIVRDLGEKSGTTVKLPWPAGILS